MPSHIFSSNGVCNVSQVQTLCIGALSAKRALLFPGVATAVALTGRMSVLAFKFGCFICKSRLLILSQIVPSIFEFNEFIF